MCITFCNFRVQSAISSWSCSGVFFSVAFEEEIQVRDGVQLRHRPYREYCVLMGFGLFRANASAGLA